MPLPTISNVYRVSLEWSYTGQHAVNVLHFRDNTGTQDEDNLYTAMNAEVTNTMWASVSADAGVDQVHIIKLDGTSPTAIFNTGRPTKWKGGPASQPIPQVAAILSLRTAVRGPRGRGRLFLPFTAESVTEGGFVAGAYTTDLQVGWGAFQTAMLEDHDFDMVVASYAHSDAHNVVSISPRAATGTQRRRQDRNQ